MVRHLRGLVPPDRVHETYYVDFADRQRCVGLNLLDMTLGLDVDKCGGGSQSCDPRDLIGLGEALWSKYWGPRMEAVWRYATRTLALINVRRVAMGVPERQYTILDVPPLLLAPRDRREPFGPAQGRPFLLSNLPLDTPDGPVLSHVEGQNVRWWWSRWYFPSLACLVIVDEFQSIFVHLFIFHLFIVHSPADVLPGQLRGCEVSSQHVGANPRGRPLGQVQGLPLPRFIEKIRCKVRVGRTGRRPARQPGEPGAVRFQGLRQDHRS